MEDKVLSIGTILMLSIVFVIVGKELVDRRGRLNKKGSKSRKSLTSSVRKSRKSVKASVRKSVKAVAKKQDSGSDVDSSDDSD